MPARTSYEKAVCPSDKRMICDKTEERFVQIFIPYERPLSLAFWEEEWWVEGASLLLEISGQADAVGAKSPIFSRYSLVAPQR